jgi:hypothetical protein
MKLMTYDIKCMEKSWKEFKRDHKKHKKIRKRLGLYRESEQAEFRSLCMEMEARLKKLKQLVR